VRVERSHRTRNFFVFFVCFHISFSLLCSMYYEKRTGELKKQKTKKLFLLLLCIYMRGCQILLAVVCWLNPHQLSSIIYDYERLISFFTHSKCVWWCFAFYVRWKSPFVLVLLLFLLVFTVLRHYLIVSIFFFSNYFHTRLFFMIKKLMIFKT
jgi:hypothetical protein